MQDAKDAQTPNQNDIDFWTKEVARANDEINSAKEKLAKATQNCKDFEAAIASFAGDDLKAYDAALEALKSNAAVTAYIAAEKAYTDAGKAYNAANSKYIVARNLYYNGVDAKQEILNLESNIANTQKWIVGLSNEFEISVQQAKDAIARLTTQIAAQQSIVDLAKKNLDAAIAAQK